MNQLMYDSDVKRCGNNSLFIITKYLWTFIYEGHSESILCLTINKTELLLQKLYYIHLKTTVFHYFSS